MKDRDLSRRQVLGLAGAAAVVSVSPAASNEPAEYPVYKARGLTVSWAGNTASKPPARSRRTSR